MAAVLNRTTKQYIPSANTPDYPVVDWIINPDLSAVVDVPNKYWVITGDVVSEMTQEEKDAYEDAQPRRTFQFWETGSAPDTTSTTYQEGMSQTAKPMNAGEYRLTWSCELKLTATDALDSKAFAQFSIDSDVKVQVSHDQDDWTAYSGWDRYNATEGETPVLAIHYRRSGGDDTVSIRRMKIGIEYMG